MLTAYGLLEFSDMSEVAYVDPDLLARVVSFLTSRNGDGSWSAGLEYSPHQAYTVDGTLAATAYIAWGLADAGYAEGSAVQAAVYYLQSNTGQLGRRLPGSGAPPPDDTAILRATAEAAAGVTAEQPPSPLGPPDSGQISTYTLALVANALTAAGANAGPVLDELLAHAEEDGSLLYWTADTQTYLGSYGEAANIETTALVAQAFLRGESPEAAQGALDFLVANHDPGGSFYTTQATVQALKALLLAAEPDDTEASATVTASYTHRRHGGDADNYGRCEQRRCHAAGDVCRRAAGRSAGAGGGRRPPVAISSGQRLLSALGRRHSLGGGGAAHAHRRDL